MDVFGIRVPRVVKRRRGGGEGKAVGAGIGVYESRDGMSGVRCETRERTTLLGAGAWDGAGNVVIVMWGSGCCDVAGVVAAAHARAEAAAAQVPRCQEDRQAHVPRHVHEGEGERVQEQAGVDGEHPQVEGGEGAREDAVGPVRGAAGKEQGDQGAEDREEGGAAGAGDSRGGPRAGHRGASERGPCEDGPCEEVEEVSVNAVASGRFFFLFIKVWKWDYFLL